MTTNDSKCLFSQQNSLILKEFWICTLQRKWFLNSPLKGKVTKSKYFVSYLFGIYFISLSQHFDSGLNLFNRKKEKWEASYLYYVTKILDHYIGRSIDK